MYPVIQRLLRVPFVRDLATMQVGQVIVMGCSFLSSILYVRLLGISGYGQYAIVGAFTGIIGPFTNLGQQTTTLTFLAEAYSRGNRRSMAEVLHYYLVFACLTAIVLAVLIPLLPLFSTIFYGTTTIGRLAQLVFFATICDIPFIAMTIALQVVRRIKLLTLLTNGTIVVQLLLTCALLLLGWGVPGMLIASLVTSIIFSCIGIGMYGHMWEAQGLPGVKEVLAINGMGHLWRYGRDGLLIALDKNLGNLYPNVFLFALSILVPQEVLALIRLAIKLAGLPISFVLSNISRLSSSVIPSLVHQGPEILSSNLRKLVQSTVVLHAVVSMATIIVAVPLIPIVYGDAFRPAIFPFIVITLLQLTFSLHSFTTPIYRLASKTIISSAINFFALSLGLGLFLLLSPALSPVRALYVGLAAYHLCASFIIVPALLIIRNLGKSDADGPGRHANAQSHMQEKWNSRAQNNAYAAVMTGKTDWTPEEYDRTGEEHMRELILPMLQRIGWTSNLHRTALDLGCGTGRMTKWLGQRFGSAIGTDVSEIMIAQARQDHHEPNLTFIATNGIDLSPVPDASIDFCFSFAALQHVPRRSYVLENLREVCRVLKPTGWARIELRGAPGNPPGHVLWFKGLERCYIALVLWRGMLPIPFFRSYNTLYGACFREEEISDFLVRLGCKDVTTHCLGGRHLWIEWNKPSEESGTSA
jgi:SAM-dependent methyltransferase/O-antigen/teichoic acid export membrane protein